MKVPMKPTVPDVLPLVNDLYKRAPVGCCLHVVLDDWNVDNHSVDFCIEQARTQGHGQCEELARTLRAMSRTQRLRLARNHN